MYASFDGTEQLANGTPHFKETTKDERKERLPVKLHVAYVYNIGVWTYTTLSNVKGDPNLTVEVMQRTFKHVERKQGFLPPTLYLQVCQCLCV